MKKFLIASAIIAAFATVIAMIASKLKNHETLDEEDECDDFFGNDEGSVDVDVRDYMSEEDIDVPVAEDTIEEDPATENEFTSFEA